MTSKRWVGRYWRLILLIAAAVALTVLTFGYQPTGTAQSQTAQISLNSPVSFPGDI